MTGAAREQVGKLIKKQEGEHAPLTPYIAVTLPDSLHVIPPASQLVAVIQPRSFMSCGDA